MHAAHSSELQSTTLFPDPKKALQNEPLQTVKTLYYTSIIGECVAEPT